MKTITFSDNATLAVTDSSSSTHMEAEIESYAELDAIRPLFTAENMSTLKITGDTEENSETVENLLPVSIQTYDDYGHITVTITNRQKSEMELMQEKMKAIAEENAVLRSQVDTHDEAIGEIGEEVSSLAEKVG